MLKLIIRKGNQVIIFPQEHVDFNAKTNFLIGNSKDAAE